jgi:hypothetical protein
MLDQLKNFTGKMIFNRMEWKSAIKMGIAATLSFYLGLHFTKWIHRPDPLASGLWCVLATIVVLQPYLGSTYKAVFNRFLGVLVGSLSGALFASLIGTWEFSLGLAILVTILLCSLFNLREGYRIASLSVAAVMIPWGLNPQISPWSFAFFRSIDTFLGLLVAVCVAYSIWPAEAIKKVQSNVFHILSLIHQLYQQIFIKGIQSNEKDSNSFTEPSFEGINQLIINNHLILEEAKMELFLQPMGIAIWFEVLASLEHLLYIVQSLQTVFNQKLEMIFDPELRNYVNQLMSEISQAFNELKLKIIDLQQETPTVSLLLSHEQDLNNQLVRFRYTHTTRKFSFPELEQYFFFIYNLKSLIKEIERFKHVLDSFYAEQEKSLS